MKNICNIKKDLNIEVLINNNINYEIKLGKVKSLRIHFNKKGLLLISAPLLIKDESIIKFIEKNISWILDRNQIIDNKIIKYDSNTKHYFLGKEYTLKTNYSKTNRVDVVNDILIVSLNEENNVRKSVIKYRYDLAEKIFNEVLYQAFLKMNQYLKEYPKLIIKESKSKWGCCYIKENKIMINVALTQAPLNIIEYVVYHELTHFIVASHSKEFHKVLSIFITNERILSKELKQYTTIL